MLLLGHGFLIRMLRLPYPEFGVVNFIIESKNVFSSEIVGSQMQPVSLSFEILRFFLESRDLSC